MKKPVKITLISVGSLIGLVLLAAAVLVWVVLTPKRLTPIVNKAAASFVTCPTKIGSVELTFFSTFPKVSLRVDDVLLLNPMKGAPSDTLLRVERLDAAVNIRKLLKEDVLEVKSLHLKNGDALLYTDAEGRQNFDVLAPSDTLDTTASEFPFEWISAKKLNLEHLNVTYVDDASHMNLHLDDFNTRADAELSEESFDGQLKADIGRIMFHLADSSRMDAALGDVRNVHGPAGILPPAVSAAGPDDLAGFGTDYACRGGLHPLRLLFMDGSGDASGRPAGDTCAHAPCKSPVRLAEKQD